MCSCESTDGKNFPSMDALDGKSHIKMVETNVPLNYRMMKTPHFEHLLGSATYRSNSGTLMKTNFHPQQLLLTMRAAPKHTLSTEQT